MNKNIFFRIVCIATIYLFVIQLIACSADKTLDSNDKINFESDSYIESESTSDNDFNFEERIIRTNYNGAEFKILGRSDGDLASLHAYELTTEEQNGDIINDTVFERNSKIADYFNIDIITELLDRESQTQRVQTSVLAGDNSFDLLWGFVGSMSTLASGGYLTDFYSIPEISLDMPWWNQTAVSNLTIGGRLLLALNDIPFTASLFTHCMFMNKNIAADYGFDNIYDIVKEGAWTITEVLRMTSNTRNDLNGDGIFDENDFYGFMSSFGAIGIFQYSSGQEILQVDSEGRVELLLLSERMQAITETTYKFAYENNSSYIVDNLLEPTIARMFASGKSLFYSGFISDPLLYFRDMQDDFALIPFPKYNENQEKYYTSISGGNGMLGVPKNVHDFDMIGAVTEALAIESYLNIRPAVLDTVMVNKLLRDDDSVEMFDIILSGIRVDFGWLYTANGFGRTLRDLMTQKSTDLTSYYASRESAAQKYYEEVVAAYLDGSE